MLLWLVFALMTAAVVGLLLHPLLAARTSSTEAADASVNVYRDQLSEIDTEAARGLIGADEAQSARAEIARRLLATAPPTEKPAPAAGHPHAPRKTSVAMAIAAAIPAIALLAYLNAGSPTIPSQPIATRRVQPPADPELAKLIGAVEARLKSNPADGRGWDVIAPVYLKMGRYMDAAGAYGNANRLLGESARRLAGLAEARMLAEEGSVGPEARAALKRLLELEPGNVQARFWLAFALEQDGKLAEASAEYGKLLAEAPPDVSWRPMLEDRLKSVQAVIGNARQPATPPAVSPGPNATDIANAERMSATERQAMIDGMVTGLAARLEKDGRDLAGWQRLIRAYSVLGRKDDAIAALDRARKSLADEPTALATLADLAKSLGLDT